MNVYVLYGVIVTNSLLALYLLMAWVITKFRSWRNKTKFLNDLANNYMNKLKCRDELLMHFDWELSCGEKKTSLARQISQYDKDLHAMYTEYGHQKATYNNKLKY